MMVAPSHKTITTINAIARTIQTDKHVFSWFHYLVTLPKVKAQIIAEEDRRGAYALLEKNILYKRVSLTSIFCLLLLISVTKDYLYLLLLIPLIYPLVRQHLRIKKCVAQISTHLLSMDFDQSVLGEKTLYQIGEFYSRKYHVKSLVAAMTAADVICRRIILFSAVFALFVYPLRLWKFWGVVLCAYLISYEVINSSLFYKHVK